MNPPAIQPPSPTRANRFMTALRKVQNDRGKMAALRRAASPRTACQAWPVIASLGEDLRNQAAVTIAALYAEHPIENVETRNFGQTCRAIALKDASGPDVPDSFERRFRRLIACDTAGDVAAQLRAWIRLAASRAVGVNYEQLFNDIAYWENNADKIRVRWATGFWPARQETAEDNGTTA